MGRVRVAIVGAGGWGTALAVMLAHHGREVALWARRSEHAGALRSTRVNATYLPKVALPESIQITDDLTDIAAAPFIILAVPSQALRQTWSALAPLLQSHHTIANAAKGLEIETGRRLSEVLSAGRCKVPAVNIAVLSGPNHAEEVGRGLPTTSVIAAGSPGTAESWQEVLMGSAFRVYTNDDVIGVELGGALKNVIALAAGICDGLGFGDNTKAALLTRGLAEMSRLGVAMGAHPLTFSGLSGMGDLIATCTSDHSRNTRAGRLIGQGQSVEAILAESAMVVEGVPTCRAALSLAAARNVDMPITQAVGDVLFEGKSPKQAVQELMARGPKDELGAILNPGPRSTDSCGC